MTLVAGNPLTIEDFTGGMTDQVPGRPPKFSGQLWNYQIEEDGSLKTRPGSESDGGTDTQNKLTSGVAALIGSLASGEKPYKLSTDSNKGKLYSHNGSTHAELTGPSGNSMFTTAHGSASDTRFSHSRWNDQLFVTSCSMTQRPRRVFIDIGGTLRMRTLGLPKFDGTLSYGVAGTAGTYLYAIVWKHTYTVGARTYIDRSDPYIVAKGNIQASVTGTAGTLVNSGGESYFASAFSANESLVLEVYRTVTTGNVFYLVGSIDYGSLATGVTDGIADGTLDDNATLYTTGGFPARMQVPVCKFAHVTEEGIGLYAYAIDGADTFKNRVYQSLPGIPGSTVATFFAEMSEEVKGISSYKSVPIVFGEKSIYRGEGKFSLTGDTIMTLRKFNDGVGCISHASIIQTLSGVFFAASSGFYWTDGFKVTKISDEINTRFRTAYSTTARSLACVAAFDETNLRIFWTAQDTSTSDKIFVFHLRYGIKPDGVFTEWGGFTAETHPEIFVTPAAVPTKITQNFRAKCMVWLSGVLYRGDDRGYTFIFDDDLTTDPRVNTAVATHTSWGTNSIYYRWESVALHFGSAQIRKWTPSVAAVFRNRGNLSVSPIIDRDLSNAFRKCREIKQASSASWMQDGVLWGDPVLWSSESAFFIYERRFPARGLRCTYRTVGFTNAFTVIQKSDNLGKATIDPVAKTVTLLSGSWPDDVLDYYMCFKNDTYIQRYLITARTSTVLTLSDPNNFLPAAGSYKWEMQGYAKGEVLDVESVSLPYTLISPSQTLYRTGTEGDNA